MDICSFWRETGDYGPGKRLVGEGGLGVNCEGGPVVLVLEVVEDLGCEVVEVGGVRGLLDGDFGVIDGLLES